MSFIDADLKQFLCTGLFGPITVGMTKTQVELLLGKPHDRGGSWPEWSQTKQEQAYAFTLPYTEYPIWKYDAIEFHFGDRSGQLYLIWCDHLDQLTRYGRTLHLDLWILGGPEPLHKEQCIQRLKHEGIPFQDRLFPNGGHITISGGGVLVYEMDEEQPIIGIELYDEQYAV